MRTSSTICALATAPAPAGVAIIRLSGPHSSQVLRAMFVGPDPISPPRTLQFGAICEPTTGAFLDQCLVVFFQGKASFTGEDSAEIHCHGNLLIIQNIIRLACTLGAEPARPGEFSERAFLNGKMDLAQAEALADLIGASSERALNIAQEQLQGTLSKAVEALAEPLRDVLAEIEASIDFPEEDIQPKTIQSLKSRLLQVRSAMQAMLESYRYGHVLKEGLRILLCGKPNAGKSSVLNMLLGKKRALVSSIAGTTRDLIEEELNLDGYRVLLCDSAGLRVQSSDEVERMGIELALERMRWADLIIIVVDATDAQFPNEIFKYFPENAAKPWLLFNKSDLGTPPEPPTEAQGAVARVLSCSAQTHAGLSEFRAALIEEIQSRGACTSESSLILTNERQRVSLASSLRGVEQVLAGVEENRPLELLAADVRESLRALEEIVGRTYTEDILGRIFSKFCIGK